MLYYTILHIYSNSLIQNFAYKNYPTNEDF